jgi:hypothetical protein
MERAADRSGTARFREAARLLYGAFLELATAIEEVEAKPLNSAEDRLLDAIEDLTAAVEELTTVAERGRAAAAGEPPPSDFGEQLGP